MWIFILSIYFNILAFFVVSGDFQLEKKGAITAFLWNSTLMIGACSSEKKYSCPFTFLKKTYYVTMKIQENCGITWVICFQASFLAIQILFFFSSWQIATLLKWLNLAYKKKCVFSVTSISSRSSPAWKAWFSYFLNIDNSVKRFSKTG